ncbi:MAG: hypothetical protein JW946_00215 [Candidatus Omnitrophica bacterium]|nr:hypothetical protein [Candidatus Omnitrophota bacterium]
MAGHRKKGSIIIAFVFIIMLSLTAASFFFMLGGRASLTTNQLKRMQAVYYTEAALYETFNRFRTGQWNRVTFVSGIVNVNNVNITVTKETSTIPYRISAEVNCSDIRM